MSRTFTQSGFSDESSSGKEGRFDEGKYDDVPALEFSSQPSVGRVSSPVDEIDVEEVAPQSAVPAGYPYGYRGFWERPRRYSYRRRRVFYVPRFRSYKPQFVRSRVHLKGLLQKSNKLIRKLRK